jgi:MFS family permease
LAISVDGRYKERLSGSPFMSAAAESFQHVKPDDNLARRNAIVLAVAQALAGGNNTVVVSTSSIVGAVLAPDKGLATLPVTAMVFGMWFGTLPLGFLARHYGRSFALQCGSAFGILSGLISYAAVMSGNFWVLLIGTFCGGVYAAAHQSYRFAAADTASDAYRPKVVSWVFAGGVFAAVLGPQLVIFTKDLFRRISLRRAIWGSRSARLRQRLCCNLSMCRRLARSPTTARGLSGRSCAARASLSPSLAA